MSALSSPLAMSGGTTEVREHMTLRLMRKVGLRLLIIDELHNVLSGGTGKQREVLNLIRYVGNELRLLIVGLGTKEAYLTIRLDDQFENRFEPFLLPHTGRIMTSWDGCLLAGNEREKWICLQACPYYPDWVK